MTHLQRGIADEHASLSGESLYLAGKTIRKIIVVPKRLATIVANEIAMWRESRNTRKYSPFR